MEPKAKRSVRKPSRLLADALEILHERGHVVGTFIDKNNGRCCLAGAVLLAIGVKPDSDIRGLCFADPGVYTRYKIPLFKTDTAIELTRRLLDFPDAGRLYNFSDEQPVSEILRKLETRRDYYLARGE